MIAFTKLSRAQKIVDPITIDFYALKLEYPEMDEH